MYCFDFSPLSKIVQRDKNSFFTKKGQNSGVKNQQVVDMNWIFLQDSVALIDARRLVKFDLKIHSKFLVFVLPKLRPKGLSSSAGGAGQISSESVECEPQVDGDEQEQSK